MDFKNRVFAASSADFNALAVELFNFQYVNNSIYRQYCNALSIEPDSVNNIEKIPFLPISFFKSHRVTTTDFEPQCLFESSGTTQSVNSKHFIKEISIYKKSFLTAFEKFYGPAGKICILGLLPSYLERENSSLVMMVGELIKKSNYKQSGFYLHDYEKLHHTLINNEKLKIPTLLIGVSYALLDFAEGYGLQLGHTIIMETGGMKGRREEMTREELHGCLQKNLGINFVHSEYGMTELLSQAYSIGSGIFSCPAWMKILIRGADDPFYVQEAASVLKPTTGLVNVIDLTNIYSCCFIATDDIGRLYPDGGFEILGRMDNSDIRGCSLLAV